MRVTKGLVCRMVCILVVSILQIKFSHEHYLCSPQESCWSDQITINIKHKKVNMTRKCHSCTLQTNPWHREEEIQKTYNHMISESNQLSLPHRDDFKTRNYT